MNIRNKFILKLNINDVDSTIKELLIKYLKFYILEHKLKMEVQLWYDSSVQDEKYCINLFNSIKSELDNILEIKLFNYYPSTFVWFNIINKNFVIKDHYYKFISTYNNNDELINSIFMFFSYISATLNK